MSSKRAALKKIEQVHVEDHEHNIHNTALGRIRFLTGTGGNDTELPQQLKSPADACKLQNILAFTYHIANKTYETYTKQGFAPKDENDLSYIIKEAKAYLHMKHRLEMFWISNIDDMRPIYNYTINDVIHTTSFDTVIFLTIAMCALNSLIMKLSKEIRNNVRETRDTLDALNTRNNTQETHGIQNERPILLLHAHDFKYLVKNNLVRSSNYIVHYTMQNLIESMRQFERRWITIHYHKELVHYTDLLMLRVALFLRNTYTELNGHNLSEYRTQVTHRTDEPEEYCFNYRFVQDMTWSFYCYMEKFYTRNTALAQSNIQYPDINQSHSIPKIDLEQRLIDGTDYHGISIKSMRKWIVVKGMATSGDSLEDKFKEMYLTHLVRPSERERFIRDYPSKPDKAINLLRKYRGKKNIMVVMERADLEINGILNEDTGNDTGVINTIATDLLRIRIVESYMNNFFQIQWESIYVFYQWEIINKLELIQRSIEPVIVQTFNNFAVFYRGEYISKVPYNTEWSLETYRMRRNERRERPSDASGNYSAIEEPLKHPKVHMSFIECFVLWLHIIDKDFDRRIDSGSKDISTLYSEYAENATTVYRKISDTIEYKRIEREKLEQHATDGISDSVPISAIPDLSVENITMLQLQQQNNSVQNTTSEEQPNKTPSTIFVDVDI